MASSISVVLVLAAVLSYSAALKLPSYIKACKDDANLNKCALESARAALPSIINGDRKYNIPSLNPMVIEKAEIPSNGLGLTFTGLLLHGIKDIDFREIDFDTKKQHVEVKFFIPVLTIDSDYKMDGKILVVPVQGEGKANITLVDLEMTYLSDFGLEKDSKGEDHMIIKTADFKYKMSRAYFLLENLFNGDQALGDATHKFLNESWQEVVNELGPSIIEIVKQIATNILSNVSAKVPYKDFWAN